MRRRRRRADTEPTSHPALPSTPDKVLQVCHPDWRGVRASAVAFGDPIAEAADLSSLVPAITDGIDTTTRTVVIQGWPPGAETFAVAAAGAGLEVLAVSHSAPSQHGVDAGEAEAVTSALGLARDGVISKVGVVKAGLAPALRSLGFTVEHVPNRVPALAGPADESPEIGASAGIFLFPMWRKNVTTQVLAATELGWTAHVMADPGVGYLEGADVVVHGELDRPTFLDRFGSMRMNFNVTLSECHPMMPMESYRLGVPCLLSRTSDLFRDHPDLYRLTTVDRPDEPRAIADAARRLDAERSDAIATANAELDAMDVASATAWRAFTGRSGRA